MVKPFASPDFTAVQDRQTSCSATIRDTFAPQFCRRLLLFATLLLAFSHRTQAANEADVIVYGSTPGGFCAAIAAAREAFYRCGVG